ncbi:transcriptional regulator, XRE family (plasmid) [Deferribacter desulfuricans SSM1]|uniref:Transcriptional regulator, XRE family n=1 Tax=Deferribacter desulfuricans (strain DSM 14783 / JCM 11476 / NBRC 101012 / SSM1) TaxID=639282 RepID=D3PEW5_DEFDS|nr:helix-turn-helix domain-containing protein [Deferribacter desulfuricans]BAI81757.1 transcriptional regulator, XRE family [Deferribacter desulfuricans SSM1]
MKPYELGQFIKAKRKEKKITQADLAKQAGISRQTLSKLEQGKLALVSIRTLFVVLDILGYELKVVPKNTLLPPLGEELDF